MLHICIQHTNTNYKDDSSSGKEGFNLEQRKNMNLKVQSSYMSKVTISKWYKRWQYNAERESDDCCCYNL